MFEDLNKKQSLVKEGVMYKVKLANDLSTLKVERGESNGKAYAYLPLVFKNEEKGLEFRYNQFDSYYNSDKRNILNQLGVAEDTPLSVIDVLKLMQDNDIEIMQHKGKVYFYDRVKYLEENSEASNKITAEDFAD